MLVLLTILSNFINTRIKKNIFKKEWPDNKMKTKVLRQQAAHTTYHHLPAAQQEPYIQNTAEFSGEREREKTTTENGPWTEKLQDKREQDQVEKQEIGKGNQMTALRFQTGGSPRHLRLPWGGACLQRTGESEAEWPMNISFLTGGETHNANAQHYILTL